MSNIISCVGLWQGHSAWHYLCAQSYFSGYVFFRSEKYATTSVLGLEEDVAGLDIEIPSKVKGREKASNIKNSTNTIAINTCALLPLPITHMAPVNNIFFTSTTTSYQ